VLALTQVVEVGALEDQVDNAAIAAVVEVEILIAEVVQVSTINEVTTFNLGGLSFNQVELQRQVVRKD
jgi:hypothetical protein